MHKERERQPGMTFFLIMQALFHITEEITEVLHVDFQSIKESPSND